MLELVQRCLADEDRQESVVRLSVGLVGDLADAFPQGQIKQYLLVEWLSLALRQKSRLSAETKKTLRSMLGVPEDVVDETEKSEAVKASETFYLDSMHARDVAFFA